MKKFSTAVWLDDDIADKVERFLIERRKRGGDRIGYNVFFKVVADAYFKKEEERAESNQKGPSFPGERALLVSEFVKLHPVCSTGFLYSIFLERSACDACGTFWPATYGLTRTIYPTATLKYLADQTRNKIIQRRAQFVLRELPEMSVSLKGDCPKITISKGDNR